MKILFFTDIHSDEKIVKKVLKKAKECDVLACSGDISFFGKGLAKTIKELKTAGKPLLLIHGNHEDLEDVNAHCDGKKTINMHKKIVTIQDVTFCGYGGGGFSLFDENMDEWVNTIKKHLKKTKKLITITHPPAFGTKLDKLPLYGHRGSESVMGAIIILQPALHVSGHFHETFYKKDTVGTTLLLNPGPEGIIVEI